MVINRVLATVVLVVLAAVAVGAQEQGGRQQQGTRDFLFNTLSGLVRQYQDGQEDQAKSGMRDLLVSLVRNERGAPSLGVGGQVRSAVRRVGLNRDRCRSARESV